MINSVGGGNMMQGVMQRMPGVQQRQQVPTGGAGASERVENDLSQRASTARASEPVARAATEAKGMFVDIYA